MKYLFEEQNLKVLESFIHAKCLFAFDYDGTLSPITGDRDNACMTPEVSALLKKLSEKSTVAIITGRSVEDIKKFLDFKPQYIIGNHGIEGFADSNAEEMRIQVRGWIERLQHYLGSILKTSGIEIEDKVYSLSIHYRKSAHSFETEQLALSLLQKLSGARIIRGKYVLNVVPEHATNKGRALEKLMKMSGNPFALYAGDDYTDEDVFRMVNPQIMSVRIGNDKPSAAQYHLNSQEEIKRLLEYLTMPVDLSLSDF